MYLTRSITMLLGASSPRVMQRMHPCTCSREATRTALWGFIASGRAGTIQVAGDGLARIRLSCDPIPILTALLIIVYLTSLIQPANSHGRVLSGELPLGGHPVLR